jgi:predicted SnoaL-like aldol condensation-catalyzing enzyme
MASSKPPEVDASYSMTQVTGNIELIAYSLKSHRTSPGSRARSRLIDIGGIDVFRVVDGIIREAWNAAHTEA